MDKLELSLEEFIKFRDWGYSYRESVDLALSLAFKGVINKPYVNCDKDEFPSHIFYKEYVLFFDSRRIYSKVS